MHSHRPQPTDPPTQPPTELPEEIPIGDPPHNPMNTPPVQDPRPQRECAASLRGLR